jgi:cytochrome b6-f complex iron-sulfur subunit
MSTSSITAVCEECLTRRAFLARSATVAAMVALLDACGDGTIGDPLGADTAPPGGPRSIKVSDFPGLATVGQPVVVGEKRAAVRLDADSFLALSMVCTHQGTTIFVDGTQFECPNHGSRFANTGAVIEGPASRPLRDLHAVYDPQTDLLTMD